MTGNNPMSFFSDNVDAWGPLEWFDRLAKAVHARNRSVRDKDDLSFELYQNIASSSATRLVSDFEDKVRMALTTLRELEKANVAYVDANTELLATLESLQRENEDAKRIDPALIGICEEMEESGGHWQPCTGCYDTLEGHPTQKYDYSPALQSPVGCGCHECGGLGAVWWYMSEQDIADFEKISEELDAEHDLTMRISRLEYLLRSLCKAYAACNGEDHPAYVEARTALASTGGAHHAE